MFGTRETRDLNATRNLNFHAREIREKDAHAAGDVINIVAKRAINY